MSFAFARYHIRNPPLCGIVFLFCSQELDRILEEKRILEEARQVKEEELLLTHDSHRAELEHRQHELTDIESQLRKAEEELRVTKLELHTHNESRGKNCTINPYPAKLIYLNFHTLEGVSRFRDPQRQVAEITHICLI